MPKVQTGIFSRRTIPDSGWFGRQVERVLIAALIFGGLFALVRECQTWTTQRHAAELTVKVFLAQPSEESVNPYERRR